MLRNLSIKMQTLAGHWPARLSLIVAAVLLIVIGTVVWLTAIAESAVDRTAIERQTRFASNGIARWFDAIPKDQESITIWDDAVVWTKQGDSTWMEENIGKWMATYFGHDGVFVLDDADQPIHAMRDGDTLPDVRQAWAPVAAVVDPLVAGLREEMTAASIGLTDSTPAVAYLGKRDYLVLDGSPAIVSAKPIVPSSARLTQTPGTEYIHIAIKRLDHLVAQAIAEEYGLDGARFVGADDHPSFPAIPIVSSSGTVVDYLTWDAYRPGRLMLESIGPKVALVTIPALLLIAWLVWLVWRMTNRLDHLAFRDSLTGLPNRAQFERQLQRALARQHDTGDSIGLLLVDIDRFKNVNDSLGHPAGDGLVRQVGERLSLIAGEHGAEVARVGGDEFAVLIAGVKEQSDAERLASKIVADMQRPFDVDGERVFSSVSIGVAVVASGNHGPEDVLRWVDIALYEAKAGGRCRAEIFWYGLDEIVLKRRAIERDLRAALETGDQLDVVYQPIFMADGQTVTGAEALIRWQHPVHGPISPGVFIAIAEERRLIEALGAFVLTRACDLLSRMDIPWIAVNVSGVQLRDPSFSAKTLETLERFAVSPSRLQVEITESVLINDDPASLAAITELRRAGVSVALDDFGTGYSSLNYLRQYSVDKIKIDRSFVERLGTSREADAIVRAIVGLARAMKRRVTAEGVETVEQRDHLASLGCHELQGFLLSRPVSSDRLFQMLDSRDRSKALAS